MMQFSAQQIAAILGGKLEGNAEALVSDVAPIEQAEPHQLSFITSEKFLPCLQTTRAGVILLNASLLKQPGASLPHPEQAIIAVDNARAAMGQLLRMVEKAMRPPKRGIEQPCFISEGVSIPKDAYVGAFAYIGKNVTLGAGVQIYPQVYIGDNVTIGEGTILYAGVKVYANCRVGAQCILHSNVVIGGDGFGYETNADGVNQKIPQIGNVVIEDDVEIGAGATVDRSMLGSTVVHKNVKLATQVVVAHNSEVGESSLLSGQVGLAGSVKIGHHCMLGGQVGVADHVEITDHCLIAAKAGVTHNVRQPGLYAGFPSFDMSQWRRSMVGFKQLPDILKRLEQLEKKA